MSNADILDVIADRFLGLGATKSRELIRHELQSAARRLRDIMDMYARYGCVEDRMPVFVLDSVGRVDDHFVAKVSIDGYVSAAVIRYWPDPGIS